MKIGLPSSLTDAAKGAQAARLDLIPASGFCRRPDGVNVHDVSQVHGDENPAQGSRQRAAEPPRHAGGSRNRLTGYGRS